MSGSLNKVNTSAATGIRENLLRASSHQIMKKRLMMNRKGNNRPSSETGQKGSGLKREDQAEAAVAMATETVKAFMIHPAVLRIMVGVFEFADHFKWVFQGCRNHGVCIRLNASKRFE